MSYKPSTVVQCIMSQVTDAAFQVFWSRYQELNEWERIVRNIEKGEQKIQRQQDIMNAISVKLDRYKNPWLELKVCRPGCGIHRASNLKLISPEPLVSRTSCV